MNLERAQELKNSELWNDVVLELGRMIDLEIGNLRKCKPDDVIRIQERINVYEFIRNLPQVVIDREN